LLGYIARHNKHKTFSQDEALVEMKSTYFNSEQLMITAEMMRQVQNAIMQLTPKCKLVFKLVKEDGLKYKEVATLLNLSLKTIENQITIALRRIASSI
jgi:RNA polymerase sigma factor (sigma-70 family)